MAQASLIDTPAPEPVATAPSAPRGTEPGRRTLADDHPRVVMPAQPGSGAPSAGTSGIRTEAARDLPPGTPGLRVDVLKVPHHGSRHQDLDWLTSLGARVALVSVGEDNDYGHPAPDVLLALSAAGARVWRSDTAGDVVVVAREGEVGVVTRG